MCLSQATNAAAAVHEIFGNMFSVFACVDAEIPCFKFRQSDCISGLASSRHSGGDMQPWRTFFGKRGQTNLPDLFCPIVVARSKIL
jgi:hypothetical protein